MVRFIRAWLACVAILLGTHVALAQEAMGCVEARATEKATA